MPGPGAALAALALLIVIASAVFHHRVRLADEAANPPEDTPSDPGAPVAPVAQAPRSVRRIVALPYALFAAAVVAMFAIGSALTFWSISGSGSGGIGSVSAGISEAIVETILGLVVALAAVVVISTFGRRPR